jgi:DNA-directed RNA polymerase specialized sigma24 family protein
MQNFADLYATRAAYVYELCYRLEGDSDKAEQLFADVWKRAHESFPEAGEIPILLCRHLGHSHRRLGRAMETGTAGAAVEVAIASLAPEYRLPLVLKETARLSYSAIASALDIPQSTVRARLGRARALVRGGAAGTTVDDELLSAYLDGELEPREAVAVDGLLKRQQEWRHRLELFRTDSEAIRALGAPSLSAQTKDIAYRSVTESFAMGAERRRVPRYKRRWMLLAAFAVPCLLSLLYLQNPTRDSRLYLRDDQLVLRAGRSGQKAPLAQAREWTSPRLWGTREGQGPPSISFQVDAGKVPAQSVQASVSYDFNGDGKPDRKEQYEAASLDGGPGWERFRPRLLQAKGGLQDFQGGTVTVRLESRDEQKAAMELSGTPGELVLPYRHLTTENPKERPGP